MKLSDLKTFEEILAEESPEFRAEWARLAPARAVAALIIRYRVRHDLTQAQLAQRLGVAQSAVARLESGEHNPRLETLMSLSRVLGIEVVLDFSPADREAKLVTKRARENGSTLTSTTDDCRILVAAA